MSKSNLRSKSWPDLTVRQWHKEDISHTKQQQHHSSGVVQLVDASMIYLQQIEVDDRVSVGDGSQSRAVEPDQVLANASST
jgi:hypothetical protein